MDILIICKSYHRHNTEKVAKAMAEVMHATLVPVEAASPGDLPKYDLIGFGSGIYGGKHHKTLFSLLEGLPRMEKDSFIFSTAGTLDERWHRPLREALVRCGFRIAGEFCCPGEVSPLGFNMNLSGALGWLAGKNKYHPDEKDLEDARAFARGLIRG